MSKTAPVYDHTASFQEAFGVYDAAWFIRKAERELGRYHAASDSEGRVDSLLNFSSSIIALEDWALPREGENEADWRGALRSESAAHSFIVLIALVAKHRRIGDKRFSGLRFDRGRIQVWTEDPTPERTLEQIRRVTPSARVAGVRTELDDDQIVGYQVAVEVDGLSHGGALVPLERVMQDAMAFWKARIDSMTGKP